MAITLLDDRVILLPLPKEEYKGRLALPDRHEPNIQAEYGVVVNRGLRCTEVSCGERVWWGWWAGMRFDFGEGDQKRTFVMIRELHILMKEVEDAD
jgi:hypothetical protein